jgi:hypothetical protein
MDDMKLLKQIAAYEQRSVVLSVAASAGFTPPSQPPASGRRIACRSWDEWYSDFYRWAYPLFRKVRASSR